MKKEKTIKLTEQSLREMIDDTIKLIAAGVVPVIFATALHSRLTARFAR